MSKNLWVKVRHNYNSHVMQAVKHSIGAVTQDFFFHHSDHYYSVYYQGCNMEITIRILVMQNCLCTENTKELYFVMALIWKDNFGKATKLKTYSKSKRSDKLKILDYNIFWSDLIISNRRSLTNENKRFIYIFSWLLYMLKSILHTSKYQNKKGGWHITFHEKRQRWDTRIKIGLFFTNFGVWNTF